MGVRTHGHGGRGKRSPTYNSWRAMIERCTSVSHPRYEAYGGRGVQVDLAWRGPGGFDRFLAHIGERPEGRTLDRIDVNGHYTPGNVKWSTVQEQRHNRRDYIKAHGEDEEEAPEEYHIEPLYEEEPKPVAATDDYVWPF